MFVRRQPVPSSSSSMHAIAINDGAMALTTADTPQPARGEVQIKVAYVGVNRADLLQVEGLYEPPEGASPFPGLEVSGTITALGEGAVGWSIGEQVCALLSGGGYAEYVAVPTGQLLALPSPIDLKTSASLPEGCATAYMALKQLARLKKGERVLVHGASSGTGILVAQVALAWGAQVFGTVGGEFKSQALRERGIIALDHQAGSWVEQLHRLSRDEGIDVIVDILGTPQLGAHFKLLRKGGRLVSIAFMEGNLIESVKASSILMKNLTWTGGTLRGKSSSEKADIIEGVRKTIWPHLATGIMRPVVDEIFPLDQAEKAHNRMQQRLHIGKILLEVAP